MPPLPCPRLEFRWHEDPFDGWYKCRCVYSLVIPLREGDIRREFCRGTKTELSVQIGFTDVTSSTGRRPCSPEGVVDTPFREHAHAMWDRKALGGTLPIVAICGENVTNIEPLDL